MLLSEYMYTVEKGQPKTGTTNHINRWSLEEVNKKIADPLHGRIGLEFSAL